MRLVTLRIENPRTIGERRDGQLGVVAPDGQTAAIVPAQIAPNLLAAIQTWDEVEPRLRAIDTLVASGRATDVVRLSERSIMAPLPRTFAWLDGSAFIHHIILVRRARNAEPPSDLKTVPLMYQGISDNLLGPFDDIPLIDEAHGMDFEGEIAVVVDDVPMGTLASDAPDHIKLLMVMNDISLRELIPRELAAGFGFFHGKPASSFAPFAVTVDEMGNAWRGGRLHLPLITRLNGKLFGRPNAGEMFFSFHDLIAHAARTRRLSAGTIVGSGTVSNEDESAGSSCLAERRMLERIQKGTIQTAFMGKGDRVEMEVLVDGRSIFGKIDQKIVKVGAGP